MAPVRFRPSRWKAALLFLFMAALVTGALWVSRLPDLRIYERACGWVAAAIFGWGALIALRRLVMAGPAIEISDWGVKDFRQNIAAPWDKVKSVKVWWDELDAARVPWIALDLDDWPSAELGALGYKTGSIPVFFAVDENGKAKGRSIDGGAWGDNIPENMAPPLAAFVASI